MLKCRAPIIFMDQLELSDFADVHGQNGAVETAAAPAPLGLENGAQILLRTLIALGVDTIFGYPGGAVLPLYDALSTPVYFNPPLASLF